MSNESDTTTDDDQDADKDILVKRGNLFKWTNYLSGWQARFVIVERGTLSYYRNELDMEFGCRGVIHLAKVDIIEHDFDPPRFDLLLSDGTSWYFRAECESEKTQWVELLEDAKADAIEGRITRGGSIPSIGSRSLHSSNSQRRTTQSVKTKLEELRTYREILCSQVDSLQNYFDALQRGELDQVEPLDFKGEALTFRATTTGVLSTLQHCVDLMSRETEQWKKQLDRERSNKQQIAKQLAIACRPDLEGPNRPITEEEFFDAVEEELDKRDKLEEENAESSRLKNEPTTPNEHHLHTIGLDFKIREHIEMTIAPAISGNGATGKGEWELFCEDGEMKLYTRELVTKDGMVIDPLRAVHTVTGNSAKEILSLFWDTDVRLEWELTIETCKVCEVLSNRDLVVYQTHKRVWPAAQRDVAYVSGIRQIKLDKIEHKEPEMEVFGTLFDCWLVINYSVEHAKAKSPPGLVRAECDVAFICRTYLKHNVTAENATRNDIKTSIVYTSTINPGGWVPQKALRTVYRREYPRFLRTFTAYVAKKHQHAKLDLVDRSIGKRISSF